MFVHHRATCWCRRPSDGQTIGAADEPPHVLTFRNQITFMCLGVGFDLTVWIFFRLYNFIFRGMEYYGKNHIFLKRMIFSDFSFNSQSIFMKFRKHYFKIPRQLCWKFHKSNAELHGWEIDEKNLDNFLSRHHETLTQCCSDTGQKLYQRGYMDNLLGCTNNKSTLCQSLFLEI